ncbi:helix-turn-helix domain-containing protein [Klebsiella michiganensis]|uniref:helix-turn-helix domain-containing protein n=2 Tax=Klebsiella/Raoultella group TaxID=2890311 RepID=UPI00191A10F8|nr:Uncharacterised protein [Klebsiella oxytoca]HBM2887576.1 helix-turn-helix domain-containing protein [Klebsiella oxytoca]HDY3609271.1 helix-turn-helix domain-containing protein [Klebsiella michiganensis]
MLSITFASQPKQKGKLIMINTTHIRNNLEGIASESVEVIELLEIIYSQCDEHASKISSGVGCAIRSLRSTTSQVNSLISTTLDSTGGSKTKGGEDAFSHRIQLARENLGLSEADLARQLNTYSDHISDWECGITEPPASIIIPLANALKCDPLWLLTGNNAEVVE